MSSATGAGIVTDQLTFNLDQANPKLWKGKPTYNYAYTHNPRIDSSYELWDYGDATFDANHPRAIEVYNNNNQNISSYINTGVANWQDEYHAHWQYDKDLHKPVTVMYNTSTRDAWKAKSFNLGWPQNFPDGTLQPSTTVTLSWLQKSNDLGMRIRAGLYQRNTSTASYDFWSGTIYTNNTKVNTWERMTFTFDTYSLMDIAANVSIYMYGHYSTYGEIRIADVQFERGGVATPFVEAADGSGTAVLQRDATVGVPSIVNPLLPSSSSATIATTGISYASDNTFEFDTSGNGRVLINQTIPIGINGGADDLIDPLSACTIELWSDAYPNTTGVGLNDGYAYILYNNSANVVTASSAITIGFRPTNELFAAFNGQYASMGTGVFYDGNMHCIHLVKRIVSASEEVQEVYVDGILRNSVTSASLIEGLQNFSATTAIGDQNNNAEIFRPVVGRVDGVKFYKKSLTAAEIKQNFNAQRSKFGV